MNEGFVELAPSRIGHPTYELSIMTFLRSVRFLTGWQPDFQSGEVERPSILRFAFQCISGQGGKSAAISISSSGDPVILVRIIVYNLIVSASMWPCPTSMKMAPDRAAESLFCGWYVSIFGNYSGLDQLLRRGSY